MKFKKISNFLLKSILGKALIVILILGAVLTAGITFVYLTIVSGNIYPNIYVAGHKVALLNQQEALALLSKNISVPTQVNIENAEYTISLNNTRLEYDLEKTIQNAYLMGRDRGWFGNFKFALASLYQSTNLPLSYSIDEQALEENLLLLSEQVSQEPVYPSVIYNNDTIYIETGLAGQKLDVVKLKEEINKNISFNLNNPISIAHVNVDPSWSQVDAAEIRQRAESLTKKQLKLVYNELEIVLPSTDIITTLDKNDGYSDREIKEIVEKIKPQIEQEAQNPVFVFEDGIVKEFAAAKEGRRINEEGFIVELKNALSKLENQPDSEMSASIPVTTVAPEYSTEEVNNLGIKELLGRGNSKFSGSAASRIHNVGVATSKFHGVLLEPGETLSFNKTLGDVSTYTGYQQAYVIKNGRTVLGDGGGVCQVSTTLFRAALDAGLPILERQSHSYRVSYYEQDSLPGLDATVYDPAPDLKLQNDTPGHLLIQAYFNPTAATLAFEIYGTDDGRVATISTPQILSTSPAPEDLYVDDPTLPVGQIKQVDWKAPGARVHFKYTVTNNGETTYQKDFYSNYRPWQSVYLRGTGPIE